MVVLLLACAPRVSVSAPVSVPVGAEPGAEFLRLRREEVALLDRYLPDCDGAAAALRGWAADNAGAIDAVRAWRKADGDAAFQAWRAAHDAEVAPLIARIGEATGACLESAAYLATYELTQL